MEGLVRPGILNSVCQRTWEIFSITRRCVIRQGHNGVCPAKEDIHAKARKQVTSDSLISFWFFKDWKNRRSVL